jgi:hypothetical protein
MAAPPYAPQGPDIQGMRQQFYKTKQDDLNRNFNAAQQDQGDAINRRMTAIGQAGSGAAIGLQIKGRDQVEAQRAQASNALTGQQAQEDMQYLASNEMADKDRQFKQGMFDTEQGNKIKELDLAQKQYELDRDTTEFNKEMARLGLKDDQKGFLDGILPSGGMADKALGASVGTVAGPIGMIAGAKTGFKKITSGGK